MLYRYLYKTTSILHRTLYNTSMQPKRPDIFDPVLCTFVAQDLPHMLSVMQQLWTSTASSSILYRRPDLIQTDVHSILRCRRLLVLCVLIGQGMTQCGAIRGLCMSLCVNPSSIVNSWLVVSKPPLSAWLLSIINGSKYKVLHVAYAMWPSVFH